MSIEMIAFVDHSGDAPETLARVYYSLEGGLTCDNADFAASLTLDGVMVSGGKLLRPVDGRSFFDNLKFAGSSLLQVRPPVAVDAQAGEAFPTN